jgi:hypothetical protein
MADSFALARFKGRLARDNAPPRPRAETVGPTARQIAEMHADILMRATTMAEIRKTAELLGLSFREAYQERERLFLGRPMSEWPEVLRPEYR